MNFEVIVQRAHRVNAVVRGASGVRLTISDTRDRYLGAQVRPMLCGAVTTSLAGLLYEALSMPRVEGAGALARANFVTLTSHQGRYDRTIARSAQARAQAAAECCQG